MSLEIKNLGVHAGEFSLHDISMEVSTGSCAVLMGKSGAGKTTLMESLCGLRVIDQGTIHVEGKDITDLRPGERNIGLVPQDTVLFPHMKVRQHLEFGPSLKGWHKDDIQARVDEVAKSLQIDHLLDRNPTGLSGGEGKRVSIGRAVASKPALLCFDEALTGLDKDTHGSILQLMKHLIEEEKITTLHITHRQDEADELSDLVYDLADGVVKQSSA